MTYRPSPEELEYQRRKAAEGRPIHRRLTPEQQAEQEWDRYETNATALESMDD